MRTTISQRKYTVTEYEVEIAVDGNWDSFDVDEISMEQAFTEALSGYEVGKFSCDAKVSVSVISTADEFHSDAKAWTRTYLIRITEQVKE